MKKTKILVMTLAIALCGTVHAYAALPYNNAEGGFIVIGDRAYSISYLNSLSSTEMKSINDSISQNTRAMYYVKNDHGSEDIVSTADINGTHYTGESILNNTNPITYVGLGGEQTYSYNSTSGDYEPQSATGNAYINVQNMDYVNMLSVLVYKEDLKGLTSGTPVYYKLDNSSTIVPLGTSTNCLISNSTTRELVYILAADKTTIAQGYLDTTNTYGSSYQRPFTLTLVTNSSTGNAIGNIDNNGYATNDSLWIYYSNTADSGKLYKVKYDGTDNQPLSNDNACYINVVGDEIYYSNISDGGKIYRINSDGTGRVKVCDDIASYIVVSGNYIYYSNHSKGGNLYKVDIQQQGGSGQSLTTGDDAAYINVQGNTIYYSNNSDGKKIYSVNTDGYCRMCLSPSTTAVNTNKGDGAKFLNVSGGYIYYLNYSDGKVWKMKMDGTSNIKISSHRASAMNLAGSVIYYSNYDDGNKLYKINTDGSNETGPIFKNSVEFINLVSNSIYFTTSGKLSIASPLDGSSTVTVTQVTKPALPDKVSKVNNITANVDYESDVSAYPFPDRVPVIMSNNVIKEVVVNWDKTKSTKKGSTYTYTGTLLGYGNKVTLSLTVTASTPLSASNVVVDNESGSNNDKITVKGLTAGSVVKIYNDEKATSPKITATVATGSTSVTISPVRDQSGTPLLNTKGGDIWITVTAAQTSTSQITPTESSKVKITYESETDASSIPITATNNNGPSDEVTVVGRDLSRGDVVKVYKNDTDNTPIGSGTIETTGADITIKNLDFGAQTTAVYVSITCTGKTESGKQKVTFAASPNYGDVSGSDASNILKSAFSTALANATHNSILDTDIKLPTSITLTNGNAVTVSWVSNKTNTISISGSMASLNRSVPDSVTLTATLTEGDADYVVPMSPVTVTGVAGQEAVDLDSSQSQMVKNIDFATGDTKDSVTKNFILHSKGANGSTITWDAPVIPPIAGVVLPSNMITVNSTTGVVTVNRPAHGTNNNKPIQVTLNATFTNGGATKTGTIDIYVIPQTGTEEDLDVAYNVIPASITLNDVNTTTHQSATLNGITTSFASDINYSFVSNNTNYLKVMTDDYGNTTKQINVYQPSYTEGVQDVKLTINLSSGTQTKTKTIDVYVNNEAAGDQEFVDAVRDSMSTTMVLLGDATSVPAVGGKIYLPTCSFESNTAINGTDISGVALKVSPTVKGAVATDTTGSATISWTASDTTAIVVAPQSDTTNYGLGTIGPHSSGEKVYLTATITRNGKSAIKTICIVFP